MTPERFAELCELSLDGALSPAEAEELHAHLAADPAALAALREARRDHLLCRAGLRPDPRVAERVLRVVDASRPSRRQRAAAAVLGRIGRRRRTRAWLRWGGLAAAAVLVAALVLARPAPPPAEPGAPRITAVDGALRLSSGAVASDGLPLPRGAGLASEGGTAVLAWEDGTRMRLGAGTAVERPDAAGQRLRLLRGALDVSAAHRAAADACEIACPDAAATVVGTAFTVSVADGRSRLAVADGVVRWVRTGDGVASLVGANQEVAAAELPLPAPLLLPAGRIAALRTAIAGGREPWTSALAAVRSEAGGWPLSPAADPAGSAGRRAIGLALLARLERDPGAASSAAAAALARIRAACAAGSSASGSEAEVCAAALPLLHAADLLRGTRGWTAADQSAVHAWLEREVAPRAARLRGEAAPLPRWWGMDAAIACAAWAGDQAMVRNLADDLCRQLAVDLQPARGDRSALGPALVPVLQAVDMAGLVECARSPPPLWDEALAAVAGGIGLPPGLSGPGPWRMAGTSRGPAPTMPGWPYPELQTVEP